MRSGKEKGENAPDPLVAARSPDEQTSVFVKLNVSRRKFHSHFNGPGLY
jgi:hypothetical protein